MTTDNSVTSRVDKSSGLDCLTIEGQDMKTNQVPIIAAFTGIVILLLLQLSMPVHAKSSFAGTWEGKMNDLPGIDLNIDETAGRSVGQLFSTFKNAVTPMNRGM